MEHAVTLPDDVKCQLDSLPKNVATVGEGNSPFISHRMNMTNRDGKELHEKKTRQWIRARGRISEGGGYQAHLSALAYMSDSYFIGTISRIHDLWRFGKPANATSGDDEMKARAEYVKRLQEIDGVGPDPYNTQGRAEVGMMVSLDHTIYFHEPRRFRADEWMFTEMASPWSGDGRGLVQQHIFAADGTLIATCFQEVSFSPSAGVLRAAC